MTSEELLGHIFSYHPVEPGQGARYDAIREAAANFALTVTRNTPAGSDQSASIRHIREACFNANAAIALNGVNFAPVSVVIPQNPILPPGQG